MNESENKTLPVPQSRSTAGLCGMDFECPRCGTEYDSRRATCPDCGPSDGAIYEAVSRRENPNGHAQIDALIASLPTERECCGTFPGTPHRVTCAKYRGKLKPSNVEVTGAAPTDGERSDDL